MIKATLLILFSFVALQSQAAVQEVYIPRLDCQDNVFQDVSVNFDDEKTKKADLTISLICQRLRSKIVKQAVVSDLSRFVIDKLAPQEVDKHGIRANDFFKMFLFKPGIIGKDKFDFTEDELETIVETVRSPRYMKLRTFHPGKERMHVNAYQSGGAAYLNAMKTDRDECSMVNTLVHEYMHFIGYSHGDNNWEGKQDSVPYYFGKRAQELCEAGVI